MNTTTARRKITNICAVGIVFRAQDPSQIFIEVKDDGYPIPLGRRQLCLIGGNWFGRAATGDSNPFNTFRREFSEELSFEKPIRSTEELVGMGLADKIVLDQVESSNIEPTDGDRETLALLKEASLHAKPFIARINTVTRKALESADPQNKRDEFVTLSSYYLVPLDETLWQRLVKLQNKFGNISNESVTLVTSLNEIIEKKFRIFAGHDQALQGFFLTMDLERAEEMTIVPNITSEIVGSPLANYDDYLALYDVAKRPHFIKIKPSDLFSQFKRTDTYPHVLRPSTVSGIPNIPAFFPLTMDLLEETYRAVMEIPLANPKMNDARRELHEWNNLETNESMQAFLLKDEAKNLPLGKHFHRKKSEIFIILEGEVEKLLTAQGKEMTNRREFKHLRPGTIIFVPPNVAHTFYMAPGSRMICFSNAAFDPNDMDMTTVDLV